MLVLIRSTAGNRQRNGQGCPTGVDDEVPPPLGPVPPGPGLADVLYRLGTWAVGGRGSQVGETGGDGLWLADGCGLWLVDVLNAHLGQLGSVLPAPHSQGDEEPGRKVPSQTRIEVMVHPHTPFTPFGLIPVRHPGPRAEESLPSPHTQSLHTIRPDPRPPPGPPSRGVAAISPHPATSHHSA